jgi:hypothetical protein
MSRANDIANAMAGRLNDDLRRLACEALVDNQKDIGAEVTKKVSKTGGAALVILYQGFTNPNANASTASSIVRRYTVSLYATPIILGDPGWTADDLIEEAAKSLHNWEPDESVYRIEQISVIECDLRPDSKYLIYDLDVEILSKM